MLHTAYREAGGEQGECRHNDATDRFDTGCRRTGVCVYGDCYSENQYERDTQFGDLHLQAEVVIQEYIDKQQDTDKDFDRQNYRCLCGAQACCFSSCERHKTCEANKNHGKEQ